MPRSKRPAEPAKTTLQQLSEVAKEFKGWNPGREVLTPVKVVPTVFPQFDVATRVGGFPLQRVSLLHGPSNHGKTLLLLGFGRSFLQRQHFYFHVDAEMTTPEQWANENLGDAAALPTFMALRPENFEQTAEVVRSAAYKLRELRAKKEIPDDTSALFGIDSLQKLVPSKLLEQLLKVGSGVDALNGRGGMFQAAMNTAWMKELIPMLYHCNATIAIIARESENTEATGKYDVKYKVGGGKAVYYDSSLVMRVTRDEWVTRGPKDKPEIIGERHRVQISKTKVGHKDGKITTCYFHSSNGKLVPAGFDQARDVVDMGLACKLLKRSAGAAQITEPIHGNTYKSENDAVEQLTAEPELLEQLRAAIELEFQPEEEDVPTDDEPATPAAKAAVDEIFDV